jgi:hypothetical protein
MNWRGRPLLSHDVAVNLIGSTTTGSGLRVKARLDTRRYPTGVQVATESMDALNLESHTFHSRMELYPQAVGMNCKRYLLTSP